MRPPIIVFDLDGTLIDTAPDLIDSLNHALSRDGFERGRPRHGRRPCRHGRARHDRARLRAQPAPLRPGDGRAPSRGLRRSTIPPAFPAARAPTPACSRRSRVRRKPATSSPSAPTSRKAWRVSLIERLGLSDLFGAICGGDTFAFRKPDPRHLTETIARAGGDPNACADGRRFAHRHRHGEGGGHPGGGGRLRLHRPACARVRAEHR